MYVCMYLYIYIYIHIHMIPFPRFEAGIVALDKDVAEATELRKEDLRLSP